MDWPLAIERNRSPLLRIVAELIAMVGALTAERIPRGVYCAVLAILRPAESAARRLIVIAAHGLEAKPAPLRPVPAGLKRTGSPARVPRFQLFDSRKRFFRAHRTYLKPGQGPRLTFFPVDDDPRVPLFRPPVPGSVTIELSPARAPSETVPARSLCRRLAALQGALTDIPKQALRLARWRARRARMKSPKFTDPCRPGFPPGHRRVPARPVDEILAECGRLARERLREGPS